MNDIRAGDDFLDRFRTARGGRLQALCERAVAEIARSESRERRRRADDLATHRMLVETIVANLAYQVASGCPYPPLVAPRGNRERASRYTRRGFRQFAATLDLMAGIGWLKVDLAKEAGKASTITATPAFVSMAEGEKLTFDDFGRHESEEVLVLSRNLGYSQRATGGGGKGDRTSKELVDYRETSETGRLRRQVTQINEFLREANLEFRSADRLLDIGDRRLRRIFTIGADDPERFDRHGRLYGGWWQNLRSSERRHIRIGGEEIADLDYASMFVRLAYLRQGKTPPDGDLYAIPGFTQHRAGVKQMMSAFLSNPTAKRGIPNDIVKDLPEGCTVKKIRSAILAVHPDLEAVFERGIGLDLMFTESRILIAVLEQLRQHAIVALPMHDGIMVPASKAELAMAVMGEEAERITGFRLPVSRKPDR